MSTEGALIAGRALPGTFITAAAAPADIAATNRHTFNDPQLNRTNVEVTYAAFTAIDPTTGVAPLYAIKVIINAGSAVHATLDTMFGVTNSTQRWFLWNPTNEGSLRMAFFDRNPPRTASGVDAPQRMSTVDFLPVDYNGNVASDTDIFQKAAR